MRHPKRSLRGACLLAAVLSWPSIPVHAVDLLVDSTLGNSPFNIGSGDSLSFTNEVVGVTTFGQINQSGGTNSLTGDLMMGQSAGSNGYYFLTGGTLNVAGNIVGGAGTSFFDISGGTITGANAFDVATLFIGNNSAGALTRSSGQSITTDVLYVGVNSGSNGVLTLSPGANVSTLGFTLGSSINSYGTANLNGGTLSVAGNASIGNSGIGTANQTAGTHTVTGTLSLGSAGQGNGTYNLSGGALTTAQTRVGQNSAGAMVQTGGSHAVAGDLTFGGDFASGVGTYTLAGGTLSVSGNVVTTDAGTGTLNIDGGTLTLAPDHSVEITGLVLGSAAGSNGSHLQTSGSVRVEHDLVLGGAIGASGVYTLRGGTLSVVGNVQTVAGTGTLNLDGGQLDLDGTISVTTLNLGSTAAADGSYAVSAGSVSTQNLNVGLNGGGQFDQSGGSVSATSALTVATSAGSTGAYNLSGGTLAVRDLTNNGSFSFTGGTLALTGAFNNNGFYAQSGGSLVLPATIVHANTGSIQLDQAAQLRLLGSFFNSGDIQLNRAQLSGTAMLTNLAGGSITGPGTIGSLFSNNGGLILVTPGTTRISRSFDNAGFIQLTALGSTLQGGTISNTGSIQGLGNIANAIGNNGTIEAVGGTLVLGGSVSNDSAGLIAAGTGSKVLLSSGVSKNLGVINLTGGTFDNNGHALGNQGQISGYGVLRTGGLVNDASVVLATNVSTVNGDVTNSKFGHVEIAHGSAIFTGAVNNEGTFKTTEATVTFAGAFVNSGAYISDPSTNSFVDLIIPSAGYLAGGAGDVFQISGSFLNSSTQNLLWDTDQASLVFNGSTTQQVLLAGADKGALFSGYDSNFAWGSLELNGGASLAITNDLGAALYVGAVLLDGGLAQLQAIHSNVNIYYDPNLGANAYLGGQIYALNGAGQLIPTAVPEPSTWALLLGGLGLLAWAGRRTQMDT